MSTQFSDKNWGIWRESLKTPKSRLNAGQTINNNNNNNHLISVIPKHK